jgi:AcrR family transcriptional regulator
MSLMEETQERLLDTAAHLFARQGYAGVSMRDIGRAVGITQAAIYHHFPNKEALYIAAATYLFEKLTLGVNDQMAAADDPQERLRLLVAAMLTILDEDPRFRRLYLRELMEGDDHRLAALAKNTLPTFYEPMFGLMAELAPSIDPQLLLFSLAGLVFHHLEARKLGPHLPHPAPQAPGLQELAEHITQLFLHGIERR